MSAGTDARVFLDALAPELRPDEILWCTEFECDPYSATGKEWAGCPLNGGALPQGGVNGYVSVGAFRKGGRRRKVDLNRVLAVALDDIATDDLVGLPLEPTWILESSPFNNQAGYALTDGDDLEGVDRVLHMLSVKGFKLGPDKSGNSAVRYVRVPGCINNKVRVIQEVGQPWTTRLEECTPERRYTLARLAEAFATVTESREGEKDGAADKESDAALIADIITGRAFHDSFTRLAARWIAKGRSPGEVERDLFDLADRAMAAVPPVRVERLQAERREIPRYVREAVEKYSNKDSCIIETAIANQAKDAGAVFEAEIITALKAVRARSAADYQRYRKRAKDAGASVSELDRLVGGNGGEVEVPGQGRPLDIVDPEPWPEPVDGAELLGELSDIYSGYVALPEHAATALALWTLHSYTYDAGYCTPILAVLSPQKRCGKTRLLSLLARLVFRPMPSSNISPSAVFRTVEQVQPTLLIDEADTFLRDNEELRGVINSGHTRDLAYVIRLVGEKHEPRTFSTWSPKAIAMIGKLPGTTLDRSIVIKMSRRKKTEAIADLGEFAGAEQIRRRCIRWALDNIGRIAGKPRVLTELDDRAADNWGPLLAIAEAAAGAWPELARPAALGLSEGTEDDARDVMLLRDIHKLFTSDEFALKRFETTQNGVQIAAEDMRAGLLEMEVRPWNECNRGKVITKNWIARRLSEYDIKSRGVNPPHGTRGVSGYFLRDFTEAFERYLLIYPPSQNSATPQAAPGLGFSDLQNSAAKNLAEFSISREPAPRKGCGDAEFSQGGNIGNEEGKGFTSPSAASWSWILTYSDGTQRQKNCYTGHTRTREQILERYPEAVDALSYDDAVATIRGWLTRIGEAEAEIIEVLKRCATEDQALFGYLRSARGST